MGRTINSKDALIRAATAAIAALLLCAATASAQTATPLVPYDGHVPFACELQQLGTGVAFPKPDADPFCVEYDKTQQNVTDLGIVEFLANEPARVAIAGPKCFYYQRDHWTGSIVQGESPELWHWDGGYFFDKARGVGGVSVDNVRVMGQSGDPGYVDHIPEQWRSYFRPAGGGAMIAQGIPADPRCIAMVDTPQEAEKVYGASGPDGSRTTASSGNRCRAARGRLRGRRLGEATLGLTRSRLLARLGAPVRESRGYQRWCLIGGGSLLAGYRSAYAAQRASGRVGMLVTTSRGYAVNGVRRGSSWGAMQSKAKRLRYRFKIGRTHIYEARPTASRRLFFGVRSRKVAYLAIADPRQVRTLRSARSYLGRAQ